MSAERTIAFRSPRRPAGAFFHWESPGEPIAVYFHLNIVELLERAAVRSGEKGIAGVLLGRIENGNRPTLVVEDIEPIPTLALRSHSDSLFGEPHEWKPIVSRWSSESKKRISILGFYRSCAEGQKTLEDRDLAILNANSRDQDQIFLIIEPHAEKASSGSLFMVRGGEEVWKWDEIPFNRNDLGRSGSANKLTNPKVEERHLDTPGNGLAQVNTQDSDFTERKPWPIGLRWILGSTAGILIIVLSIVLLRGSQLFHMFSSDPEADDETSLGLKLQRTGTDLQVSWDRNAPAFLKAAGGHLSISDGMIHKTIELDSGELRSGSVFYTPVSDDVALRLDVLNGKSSIVATESVRSVAGLLPPLPGIAPTNSIATQTRTRTTQTTSLGPASKPHAGGSADPVRPAPPSAADSIGAQDSKDVSGGKAALSTPLYPPKLKGSVPAPSDPSADTVMRSVIPTPALSSLELPELNSLNSKANVPVLVVPDPQPFSSVSPRNDRVTLARLISGKKPIYAEDAQQLRISGTVDIVFRIGSDGLVRNVVSVTGPNLLKAAVVDAVKTQRYSPALLDGNPIESQSSLSYTFKLQ